MLLSDVWGNPSHVQSFVSFCRSATIKRTATARLTGPPPTVTSQGLVAAWTADQLGKQVSSNSCFTRRSHDEEREYKVSPCKQ